MPYVRLKKTKPNQKGWWSEDKKLEVLQAYLTLGQLTLAAASSNVPLPTAKEWKTSQWWRDTEADLRRSGNIKLSAKLKSIVADSLVQLEDRVTQGDYVFDRKGNIVRKQISAEHANKIATQLIDRSLILDKAAIETKEDDVGIEARLDRLAKQVAALRKPRLSQRVVESEVIDYVEPSSEGESVLRQDPEPVPIEGTSLQGGTASEGNRTESESLSGGSGSESQAVTITENI